MAMSDIRREHGRGEAASEGEASVTFGCDRYGFSREQKRGENAGRTLKGVLDSSRPTATVITFSVGHA
jgi:hypothetical protein